MEPESKRIEKLRQKTSWDAYIDNMIHQSEDEDGRCHISQACIIALEDGVRWTSNSHPKVLLSYGGTCFGIMTSIFSEN